jgi:CheY-like chemotaxis protein
MSMDKVASEIETPFLLHPKRGREGRLRLRVLIAEDDLMIADMVEEILVGHGYEVCGIARTVSEGIALGRLHKPDLAVIDLRLADGRLGTEIAVKLGVYGPLGVLYATGNCEQLALCGAEGDACLTKPYRSADLLRGLEIVSDLLLTGNVSPPFPHGFQLLPLVSPIPRGS